MNFKRLHIFVSFSLFANMAFAQGSINSHLFRTSDTLETMSVDDALGPDSELVREGRKALFRISYDYMDETLSAVDNSNIKLFGFVDTLQTATLGAGVFVHPRIWLGADISGHYVKLDPVYAGTLFNLTQWVLGDTEARLRIRLSNDSAWMNVALMPYGTIPTGSKNYLTTDDSYGFGGRLIADKHFGPVTLIGQLGYGYAKNAEFLTLDRTKRIEIRGAFAWDFYQNPTNSNAVGLNLESSFDMTYPGYDESQNPLIVQGGFRGKIGNVIGFLGAGMHGLTDYNAGNLLSYAGIKTVFGHKKQSAEVTVSEPPVVEQSESQLPSILVPAPTPITTEKPISKPELVVLQKKLNVHREIYFDTAKATIKTKSYKDLDSAIGEILPNVDQIQSIVVKGYADSIGETDFNLKLSLDRAQSVILYMVQKGIPREKFKAIGFGESILKVSPEKTPRDFSLNRRIEFRIEEIIR